jgi:hypothetical protein
MTNLKLTLLAAAAIGAASIGGASALPFNSSTPSLGEGNVQNARIVCDQFGRCWDTRRKQRSSRYYAPAPYGYSYGAYDRRYAQPGVGVGVGPFGIWVR